MAHAVAPGGLIIDRNMFPFHPAEHRARAYKGFLRHGGTVRHGHNVVRAGAVKPGNGPPVLFGNVENNLAAPPGILRRGENAGNGKVQLSDAAQRVVHTLQLQGKLLLIIHVAQRAAAAAGVYRAVRLRAACRGGAKCFAPAPYGGGCTAHDAHIPFLAEDRSGNEHGALADAADACALGSVTGDSDRIYFILFQFGRYCQNGSPGRILP